VPREFDFRTQMLLSSDTTASSDVSQVLLAQIPGAVGVERATALADLHGTDYWVVLANGKRLSIDAKVRTRDRFDDDLALETWSVIEQRVVGWTRDAMKQTDYVLWLWKDTGRWRLVPFVLLCAAFQSRWEVWSATYQTAQQRTLRRDGTSYHSECVFVPTRAVWQAIYQDNAQPKARRAA
jgi:hypothetical protein